MDEMIEIEWAIENDFGPDMRLFIEFEVDDFEDCDTEEQIIKKIEDGVKDDFEQNITWNIVSDVKGIARDILEKRAANE